MARPKLPLELVRSEQVRFNITPGQFADLQQLGRHWKVPPGTAAYAMVAEFIAWCRRSHLYLGASEYDLAFTATLRLLRSQEKYRRALASYPDSEADTT